MTLDSSDSRERWMGTLVFLLLVPGSLVCIFHGATVFPFSNYSMYSGTFTRDFKFTQFVGLQRAEDSGELRELNLLHDRYWGDQMHIGRIRVSLNRMLRRKHSDAQKQEAVAFLVRLYNERREAGYHQGPPIVGMRIYISRWKLRADLKNVDDPDQRALIAEWVENR